MLIIPLHIFSSERPGKIAAFFNENNRDIGEKNYEKLYKKHAIPPFLLNEEITNVSSKTIKNIITEKHTPRTTTLNKIESSLKSYFSKFDGIEYKNGSFKDKYTSYSSK